MNKFVIAAIAAAVILPSAAMAQPADRHDSRPATKVVIVDRHDAQRHDGHRPAVHRIAVGTRVEPAFIARHDVIKHPARYRLAKPGANARWLKVRDDAVLVNLRTGRVLNIAHSLFR